MIYVCVYTCYPQYRDVSRAKEITKLGHQWMLRAKEIFPLAILGTRPISSAVLLQLRQVGAIQRNTETRQYRINVTFIQKHDSYWHWPVSTTHFSGFCRTVCLRMVYKCWRWETCGQGEVMVVRDLRKHLDLRYAQGKQRSLQRIMNHLSQ
jgi:hypothetical protein